MSRPLSLFAGLFLLAGCASGGTDTTTSPPPPPPPPAAVATVIVTPPTSTIAVGATATLSARTADASNNTLAGRTVTWQSSASAIATVSATGVVTAVSPGGPVTITATSEGISGSAAVTVPAPVPVSIGLTRSSSYLLTGDTLQVSAAVLDAGSHTVAGAPITWSVTGAAATVNTTGTVTAVVAGDATIKAASGAINASFTVHVGVGSGVRVPELSSVDSLAMTQLSTLHVPGMSVAVTKDGRLVLSRAYGYADSAIKRAATPSNLWRIGSVTKSLTAMGVMKLVEQGKMSLDDHPFTVLGLTPLSGTADPRLATITVRQLLDHQGGWNASRNIDDSTFAYEQRTGITDPTMLVRNGLKIALANNPGTAYAYTNYEYLVLARMIEHASGQLYEPWMKANVMTPAGVSDMVLGFTQPSKRAAQEVSYYDTRPAVTALYGTGLWPDVGGAMEYSEASGQWVGSAVDMVKLLSSVDGLPNHVDQLTASTVATMWALPAGGVWPGAGSYYYALGWEATPVTGGYTMSHAGGQDGGDGYFAHRPDGVSLAFITNLTRGQEAGGVTPEAALNLVLDRVTKWPSGDQF